MASKELKKIIQQKLDNPIDRNQPIELRRQQAEENAMPHPVDASIEKVNLNGNLCYWVRMPDVSANEVLLFIHGGGYTGGSAESSLCLAAWISHETKATVFSINYRLAPEYPFPAAINDTNEIYKWVLQEGINPSKLCVAGGSAGGGLALALMIHLKKESISLPACCVLMSPWTDLSQSGDTYQINKSVDPVMKKEYLESFSEDYLQGQESSNPLASPLFGDLLGLPPTLIQVGSSEVMLDDSKRVYEKAKSAEVDVVLEEYPEMFHGWQNYYEVLLESRQAVRRVGEFFKRYIQ